MKTNGHRGISLAETLVVSGMVVIAVGMGFLNAGSIRNSASSSALAQALAGELVRARQLAISRHAPVAVCFPSLGGTTATTQQIFRLEGENPPRLTRVIDFSRENPRAYLLLGHYTTVGPAWAAGGSPLGTHTAGFDLTTWPDPNPDAQKLVFTPAGTVVSNLPRLDGSYQVVTSQSAAFTASSMFGHPLCELTQVEKPTTVLVSPLGSVTTQIGLPSAAPGIVQAGPVPMGAAAAVGPAPVPLGPPVPDQVPQVTGYRITPTPVNTTLPVGVSATLRPGGILTATIVATEPDGEPMTGNLTIRRGGLAGPIVSQTEQVLTWDATDGFTTTFAFTPPAGDPGGTQYFCRGEVFDPQRNPAAWTIPQSGVIQLLGDSRVYFTSERDGNPDIWACNPDGSDPVRVIESPTTNEYYPRVSPDSRKVLFSSDRGGITGIYQANADGSGIAPVWKGIFANGSPPAPYGHCWSPDGNQVAIPCVNGDVYVCGCQGQSPILIHTSAGGATGNLAWSDRYLVFYDSNALLVNDRSTNTTSTLLASAALTRNGEPAFSVDGTQLLFNQNDDIVVEGFAGGVLSGIPMNVTRSPGTREHNATFSPDGLSVLSDVNSSDCQIYRYSLTAGTPPTPYLVDPGCDNDPHWAKLY